MGGVFAVSTVIPEKIQRLAADFAATRQFVAGNALEHSLQVLVLSGALSADLGKQERTAPSQTAAGLSPSPQRDGHGPHRWPGGWRGPDADPIRAVRKHQQSKRFQMAQRAV